MPLVKHNVKKSLSPYASASLNKDKRQILKFANTKLKNLIHLIHMHSLTHNHNHMHTNFILMDINQQWGNIFQKMCCMYYYFFSWILLHAWLNSHDKPWSYKKNEKKKDEKDIGKQAFSGDFQHLYDKMHK